MKSWHDCIHESGHACIGELLGIEPRSATVGVVATVLHRRDDIGGVVNLGKFDEAPLLHQLITLLAGQAACLVLLGDAQGCGSDYRDALALLHGHDPGERDALLLGAARVACELVRRHCYSIKALARKLLHTDLLLRDELAGCDRRPHVVAVVCPPPRR